MKRKMKLSMWLIARNMRDYNISCDIKCGEMCIDGIRFISNEKNNRFEKHFVYLCEKNEIFNSTGENGITIINGQDIILVRNSEIVDVLNRLLSTFEFYNNWEGSLQGLPSGSSIQDFLDFGGKALGNPVVISSMDGLVVAMSREYIESDLNENWSYCRDKKRVPARILSAPHKNLQNNIAKWETAPQILLLPDGTKTVAAMISNGNENIGAASMWEYSSPVDQGSVQLMEIFCKVVSRAEDFGKNRLRQNSVSALKKLLTEENGYELLPEGYSTAVKTPLRLISFKNIGNANEVGIESLLRYLGECGIINVSFEYSGMVICLVHSQDYETIIKSALGTDRPEYNLIAVSMEFESLKCFKTRYRQNEYCLSMHKGEAGIFSSELCALDYALTERKTDDGTEALLHPAVIRLYRMDRKNGTDLYDTLYYYLLFERSIYRAAEKIHIHRNSFLYRIKKITEMINCNLEDPEVRAYILLSFRIHNCCR